jgi:site-specific DNA-methyltransferase (adenine-specific)
MIETRLYSTAGACVIGDCPDILLMQGDCLERMKEIESGSVDMVICDLPYGTVKDIGNADNINFGMKGRTAWDECINHEELLNEYNRILRTNGALILFSQDPLTGKLMTEQHGNLPFSYRYTWLKDHFANALIAKKAPVNYTEDICVFFKKYDTLAQHPLREYALKLRTFTQYSRKRFYDEFGSGKFQHFLEAGRDSTQFCLCTEQAYNELILKYGINNMEGFKPYSELKEIDSRFARRFALPENSKFKSNVLQYKKDYDGYHPTQKPVNLIEDLIKTYTIPGETILDNTMGSGTTGVAAVNTGRKFIGIELDEHYFQIAQNRIEQAKQARAA